MISFMRLVSEFWDFVDTRQVVRRIMTLGTFALTVHVILWATHFAATSTRVGSDVAMIIGALMLPINALQGFMFSSYTRARSDTIETTVTDHSVVVEKKVG